MQIEDLALQWESLHQAGFFILDTGLEIFMFQVKGFCVTKVVDVACTGLLVQPVG